MSEWSLSLRGGQLMLLPAPIEVLSVEKLISQVEIGSSVVLLIDSYSL